MTIDLPLLGPHILCPLIVYLCVSAHVHVHVYMHVYLYVCVCVCQCTVVCVCIMFVCVCVHGSMLQCMLTDDNMLDTCPTDVYSLIIFLYSIIAALLYLQVFCCNSSLYVK